jgi:peptidyl-prolyl cis-trans isomerase D
MLDTLRRGASSKIAVAIVFLPLILAFILWGIADVFRVSGENTVARVGKSEISATEFQQAYETEMTQMSRQFGQRLSPEQARLAGIDGRVLSRIVGSSAIDAHVQDLGLALSNEALAQELRNDPQLKNADGSFNRALFESFLAQNGLSEQRYLAIRRREDLREQVTDALTADLSVPDIYVKTLHAWREEKRRIAHVTIDAEKTIKIAAPDEAKLKEFYVQNKSRFVLPEQRNIALLTLTKDAVKAAIKVEPADIKAAYEVDKEGFNTPERRRITQLSFPDKAAADKAFAELSKAKNFNEAAAKLGFKEADIDLGVLAPKDMIDTKIRDAAFALKKDQLSQPVVGQFATVLLRVTEIVPGKIRTLDDVSSEVRDRLANDRATREIQTLHDKIDEERAAGRSLKDTAAKFTVPFREVTGLTRENTRDGKPVIEGADAQRIIPAAFGASAGLEAEAIELADGGYAWLDVLNVTPEQQRPFEDAKGDVQSQWLDAERRRELAQLSVRLVERLSKGEKIEVIATEVGGKVETTEPATRQTAVPGLAASAIQQAFALAPGSATSTASADGKSRTLMRLVEIIPAPPPNTEQSERLKAALARQLQTDVLAAYINGLQSRYGVTINERAVQRAIGADRQR